MALIDRIVKNIEIRRKKLGLSVDRLVKKSDVPYPTVAKIRYKKVTDVRISTLLALATALECSVDELLH
ncbi:MAG: helix-turn-helix transcriptional regulator [Candidatus Margulisiibacteriota bacterium]|jgi:DNA-binding Xre family transcriptional regulator